MVAAVLFHWSVNHDRCVVISGEVKVTLTDANGVAVPFKLIDNKDKTYRVEFQATVSGVLTANVTYAGQAATDSPYRINVESAVDLSKVQVKGLPDSKYRLPVVLENIGSRIDMQTHAGTVTQQRIALRNADEQ